VSNLSVNTITDASGGSTASINGLTPQASNMQPFNRIINGAMTIDQRNAGAAVTPANGANIYTLDRWSFYLSQASKLTTQQSSTAPTGFVNSLLVTSSSAYSVGSGEIFEVRQFVEGYNTADLMWGTANAQTVTLSFWVRSSLTGTFGGAIRNSASDRSYVFSYSISSANTYEYKTITIAGDTSATWLTTNGRGIGVFFSLGAGSTALKAAGSWGAGEYEGVTGQTNLVGTSGATFYITGVQLEAGSSASSFAHENYSDTLQKCYRYAYSTFPIGTAWATAAGRAGDLEFISSGTSSRIYVNYVFPTTMRATPTVTYYNPTNNNTNFYNWSNATDASAAGSFGNTSSKGQMIVSASNPPGTDATFGIHVSFSAEL
jgi:hypothetical protein